MEPENKYQYVRFLLKVSNFPQKQKKGHVSLRFYLYIDKIQ